MELDGQPLKLKIMILVQDCKSDKLEGVKWRASRKGLKHVAWEGRPEKRRLSSFLLFHKNGCR